MPSIVSRLRHAWNVFASDSQDEYKFPMNDYGGGVSYARGGIERTRYNYSTERTLISSIYTRMAIDAAAVEIRHVRVDDEERYLEDIDSGINSCLTLEANIDQAATAFRQDFYTTLFAKGVAALVPVDTTVDPNASAGYDVNTMRVGEVVTWYPQHVRVRVYNQKKGIKEDVILDKKFVGIALNPLYDIMNEPNSTLQRLVRKLNMLDTVDEASSSGKLDLIIQLPYVVKSDTRRAQAEQRRTDIEFQLKNSKYGVAYTDGTEKITQLNRPAENNLLKQIELLTAQLYTQLGLTPEIMNGTADEKTMLNYNSRTIAPLVKAMVESLRRTFLSKTARSQKQWFLSFRNPFEFTPMEQIAEIADKFTRNEILSSNEVRQAIGIKPSKDPGADKLKNSNMPDPSAQPQPPQIEGAPQQRPPLRVQATTGKPLGQLQRAPSEPRPSPR